MISRIATSTFKDGIGGCSGRSASPGFPSHVVHAGIFPIIFALCLNDLSSEAL